MRILAEIFATVTTKAEVGIDEVNRALQAVAGLSELELTLLVDILRSQHIHKQEDRPLVFRRNYTTTFGLTQIHGRPYANKQKTSSAFAVLAARALLYSIPIDEQDLICDQAYAISDLGYKVVQLAPSLHALQDSQ